MDLTPDDDEYKEENIETEEEVERSVERLASEQLPDSCTARLGNDQPIPDM